MAKHRQVSSEFWEDDYIVSLDWKERYLFLYFMTNEKTNILGIYNISIRRISFDTGIDDEIVESMLSSFADKDKIHYVDGWVIMVNHLKHNIPNDKTLKGIIKLILELPESVINFIISKKSRIYDRLSIGHTIGYVYQNININKDKDKDKEANFNPLIDFDSFIENTPEWITSKWTKKQILDKAEALVDYDKNRDPRKRYKNYYSALRNYLKKDYPPIENNEIEWTDEHE